MFKMLTISIALLLAICNSLNIVQANPCGERPTQNDAVRTIETRYKNETDKYDKSFEEFQKGVALSAVPL